MWLKSCQNGEFAVKSYVVRPAPTRSKGLWNIMFYIDIEIQKLGINYGDNVYVMIWSLVSFPT